MIDGRDARRIRRREAPQMTQNEFARTIGLHGQNPLHGVEGCTSDPSPLLQRLLDMIDRHGMPTDWHEADFMSTKAFPVKMARLRRRMEAEEAGLEPQSDSSPA